MPERTAKANGRKSKERSAVEHVFARQKGPMGLVIPTIGIARARTKIGLANLVYSMKRILWRPDKPLRREQNTRSGDAIISLIGQSQDESAEHIENRAIPQSMRQQSAVIGGVHLPASDRLAIPPATVLG